MIGPWRNRWAAAASCTAVLVAVAGCGSRDADTVVTTERAPSAAAAPTAPPDSRPRIVALGDSLTAGLGLGPEQAYPTLLQQRLNDSGLRYQVVNAGVSGDTSAGGLRRVDWALEGVSSLKIDLNEEGKVAGAHLVVNTVSHQIIEEFMLAANEAVARILSAAGAHFLRRIHESPDPRKLKTLTGFVKELGLDCESLESRFEIKRVVAAVAGSPQEHAVNYAVLRSMQKAVYSPEEQGHYALNSENYCHFTSPIRRYPDLTVHRMLNSIAAGKKPHEKFDAQMLLGEHCSEREQRAADAERELKKIKLLDYLSQRIGTKLVAIVTGVEEFGLFAQGVELPAEGLIHIQSLSNDYYHFDRGTHSLIGRKAGNDFRLGDRVEVEIYRVDVDRRELDLRLVKRLTGSKITPCADVATSREDVSSNAPPAKKKKENRLGRPPTDRQGKHGRGGAAKPVEASKRKKKQRPGKNERQKKKQGE